MSILYGIYRSHSGKWIPAKKASYFAVSMSAQIVSIFISARELCLERLSYCKNALYTSQNFDCKYRA